MSTFTAPLALAPTLVAAGTLLPPEAIRPALFIGPVPPIGEEPLDVRWQDTTSRGRRNWMLLVAFDFASEVLEQIVHCEAGFVTDFASTPRITWPILPPTGPYGKDAVVHDKLYRTPTIACTRHQADLTLREAMIASRVPWLTRVVVYAGVRLGGAGAFVPRISGVPA